MIQYHPRSPKKRDIEPSEGRLMSHSGWLKWLKQALPKLTYRFWVSNNGKYRDFKTWKVYRAYQWWTAREGDIYRSKTPIIKMEAGKKVEVIEITNYQDYY